MKKTVVRSLRHDQIFGHPAMLPEWTPAMHLLQIPAEDRENAEQGFARAVETGIYSTESRIIWPDGSSHWIAAEGRLFKNDRGEPVRMVGVVSGYHGTEDGVLHNQRGVLKVLGGMELSCGAHQRGYPRRHRLVRLLRANCFHGWDFGCSYSWNEASRHRDQR